MRWIFPEPTDPTICQALCAELGLEPFFGELLCRRGITNASDAQRFLQPKLSSLSDPFLLPNMHPAVVRLLAAIDRKERIVLYGDYDVDGVTSLTLFTRMLRAYGSEPRTFLPSRMDEGYGLSAEGIRRCVETLQPQLLVAVDCGTSSAAEIAGLRAAGVDVLVFDHHECKGTLPVCTALVNPKLGDDFHYLCSVGLVFKACHALLKERPLPDFDLREFLDLVALGTVADIVPLVAENRVLVRRGLAQMENTRWPGIAALIEVAAVRAPINPVDVGFRLGPRLNAAGRLGTAQTALDLLLCEDPGRARELAVILDTQNRERQAVEQDVLAQAEEMSAATFNPTTDAAIVLGGDGWHPGVLGIAASRLCKSHSRPTIVLGFDDSGLGKGSGRSIESFSLVQALGCCGEFLEKFGGHEMAAGLTIRRENFDPFRRAFLACAREQLSDEALLPRLRLDAELTLRDLTLDLLSRHESIQPFGAGNPQPLYFSRQVKPSGPARVLKEKHLRLELSQEGRAQSCIFFNGASEPLPQPPWDIAFQLNRNEFNGRVSVQIEIKAIRAAA